MNPVGPEIHFPPITWRAERALVGWLCLLASLHVFIFSAAFPFFNVVDERAHFDLALRYSHGEIPRAVSFASDEAMCYIVLYNSQFFTGNTNGAQRGELLPPPWKLPAAQAAQLVAFKIATAREFDQEASQPPLYYGLAGAWWRLGGWLGFDDGHRLYWLRFLNMPILALIVWLGWRTAGRVFPDKPFPRLAVPALIAFMPDGTFYSIQNDVLSPLCFGAAFLLLLEFWESPAPSFRLAAATGLALAATFLTKISNLPLLAVAGTVLGLKLFRLARAGSLRPAIPAWTVLSVCAGLPMALWMAWCKVHYGDLTGSKPKIAILGWTLKPVSEWLHHPVFTPQGAWTFISGLLARFWQGEISHHTQPMTFPAANDFYTLMTFGILLMAITILLRRPQQHPAPRRFALWLALFLFAAGVVFLGFLSIIYDFHGCYYPSQARPYFTSGRLILGALIPFSLLFTFGFDGALDGIRAGLRARCLLFGGFLLFMLVTEIVTDWPAFGDAYNWFHM